MMELPVYIYVTNYNYGIIKQIKPHIQVVK